MSRRKILIVIIIVTTIIILGIFLIKPNTRYEKFCINQEKWDNIITGKTENKNFVLEDIKFNDYNLIIDQENSKLYYSLINNSQTKYNPNVNFNSKKHDAKLAILLDEITDEKVKNNYEFKVMIYNNSEYHIYKLVCTELPMLSITYKEEKQGKSIPMEMYLFNNLSNTPKRIIMSLGRFKTNENDYIISLNMITPGNNFRENKISIFNMKPSSKYVLIENAQEIRKGRIGYPVELFINNKYKGVYKLENIMEKEPI